MSWKSRRISHCAIVQSRNPDMWMRARRLAVITRFVRVALGKTKRASSPGIPAASRSPYRPSEPSTCSSKRARSVGSASAIVPGSMVAAPLKET